MPVANKKVFMKAQILSHTFSVVPKSQREDPLRLETLIDPTSPWLRGAARKQKVLLILNPSHHVPKHARSRKWPGLHHFFGKEIAGI